MVRRGKSEHPLALGNILKASLYSLTGTWPAEIVETPRLPSQPSAIDAAKKSAQQLIHKDHQAESAQSYKKYVIVERAIRRWEVYGAESPEIGKKPFQDFLQGLIDLLDPNGVRGWDAGGLVTTYRRYVRRLDS